MAGNKEYDYSTIDNPYNDLLERTGPLEVLPSTGGGVTSGTGGDGAIGDKSGAADTIKTGKIFADVWLDTWMKSRNYQPKTQGFLIDGKLGYIECMQIYVGKGGIEGGSLHIPNRYSDQSWHVDNEGNMWAGCNVDDWETDPTRDNLNANAVIQNDGRARFYDIVVDSGVFIGAMFLTDTDGIHAPGPAKVRVEIGGDTPGASNDMILYEDTYYSGPTLLGEKATIFFKRLNTPHQTFLIQKRLGVMEMFYTENGPPGVENYLMIGRDGLVTNPALTYTDRIYTYAKHRLSFNTSISLPTGFSELMIYDKDAGWGPFDSNASRIALDALGSTNPYNPSTGLGGGAILFSIEHLNHGWIDKDGLWLRNSQTRPYVTDVYNIGSELNRFNKAYFKEYHFTDAYYFWLDTTVPNTVNLAGGVNFHCFGSVGATGTINTNIGVVVGASLFTAQSITYLDGGGIPTTRTFLVV